MGKKSLSASLSKVEETITEPVSSKTEEVADTVSDIPAAPISVEEIDKSIDEMVKEA